MKGPAKRPCGSCPYRLDTPSGIWAADEYEKLSDYDNPTADQPLAVFVCHQQDGRLCAGWVGCHDMHKSIGLRIATAQGHLTQEDYDAAIAYESPVPLFESGEQAEEHGLAELRSPSAAAQRSISKLQRRRAVRANHTP